jgi:hypothetical protein
MPSILIIDGFNATSEPALRAAAMEHVKALLRTTSVQRVCSCEETAVVNSVRIKKGDQAEDTGSAKVHLSLSTFLAS